METRGWAFTHNGHIRKSNEDEYLVDDAFSLYIVCDGSQSGDGKWAARTVCDKIQEELKKGAKSVAQYQIQPTRDNRLVIEKLFFQAIQNASQKIFQESHQSTEKLNSLTTLEALFILSNCAILAHIGNSRTYHMRGEKSVLLTKDHTRFEEMVDSGMWEPQYINPQFKKRLTRIIGMDVSTTITLQVIPVLPGDLFLICSDGLSDSFLSNDIKDFLPSLFKEEVQTLPQKLIQNALKKEVRDNLTVVTIQIVQNQKTLIHENSGKVHQQLEIIKKVPIFKELSENDLNKIYSLISVHTFKKGEMIIEQGKKSDRMFIVLKGQANVLVNGEKIGSLEEGSFLGEMGFFNTELRSASVIAKSEIELISIDKKDFLSLISIHKDLGLKVSLGVIQDLSNKLRNTSQKILTLTHLKTNPSE